MARGDRAWVMSASTMVALQNCGWSFYQTGPDEWGWLKFDGDGKCIGQQGDQTWIDDLVAAENT